MRYRLVVVTLIALLLLTGCRAEPVEQPVAQPAPSESTIPDPGPVEQLVSDLQGAGLSGAISDVPVEGAAGSFFAPPEYMVKTNGGAILRVFVFPNSEESSAAAATVQPDGVREYGDGSTAIGTRDSPEYPAPVHFFRRDELIVIYFEASADRENGETANVLKSARKVLGDEFAKSGR